MLRFLNVEQEMQELVSRIGWTKLFYARFPVYGHLVQEFFSTLTPSRLVPYAFTARILDHSLLIDDKLLHDVFKLPLEGVKEIPEDFDMHAAWFELSNENRFYPKNSPERLIRHPCFVLLHKFLSFAFCGKTESNKVSLVELFLLSCFRGGRQVAACHFLLQFLEKMAKESTKELGLGHIVTAIARHLALVTPEQEQGWMVTAPEDFSLAHLTKSKIISSTGRFTPLLERRQPAAPVPPVQQPGAPIPPQQQPEEAAEVPLERRRTRSPHPAPEEGFQAEPTAADLPSSSTAAPPTNWQQELQRIEAWQSMQFDLLQEQNRALMEELRRMSSAQVRIEMEQLRSSRRLYRFLRQQGFEMTPPTTPPPPAPAADEDIDLSDVDA